jgi:hypothetical protein
VVGEFMEGITLTCLKRHSDAKKRTLRMSVWTNSLPGIGDGEVATIFLSCKRWRD